jgi:hypothetical protein
MTDTTDNQKIKSRRRKIEITSSSMDDIIQYSSIKGYPVQSQNEMIVFTKHEVVITFFGSNSSM